MKRIVTLVFVLGALAAIGAAAYWWTNLRVPDEFGDKAFGDGTRNVDIPVGSNPRAVSKMLAETKVVSDADVMYRWLRQENLGPKLRGGEYEFVGPMTPRQVVEKIVSGQVKLYHFN